MFPLAALLLWGPAFALAAPNTIHFRGHWQYTEHPLLNYSRALHTSSYANTFIGTEVCDVPESRAILDYGSHYTWVPAEGTPALEPFNSHEFLRLLDGRNISIVGDSMQQYYFAVLITLLEGHGATVEDWTIKDNARRWAGKELVLGKYSPTTAWKVSVPDYPPVWIRYTSARTDFIHYQTFEVVSPANTTECSLCIRAGKCFEFPTNRWLYPIDHQRLKTQQICYAASWSWLLPYTDILVLNFGQWYHWYDKSFARYPEAVRNVLSYLQQVEYKGKVIYKATSPGHQKTCNGPGRSNLKVIKDVRPMTLEEAMAHLNNETQLTSKIWTEGVMFRWDKIRPMENAWQEQAASWPADKFIFQDDFEPFLERPDGKVDCVHYCSYGPVLWFGMFFYKTVKQLLNGSPH